MFLKNPNVIKVNSTTHICRTRNYLFLFVITHWSSFKGNNILPLLNAYKIPLKEHQVVEKLKTLQILKLTFT